MDAAYWASHYYDDECRQSCAACDDFDWCDWGRIERCPGDISCCGCRFYDRCDEPRKEVAERLLEK